MNDDHRDYCADALAWHLERASSHANEMGLTRVVSRLRRLRVILPDVPEQVSEPDPVVREGPRTIDHPIDRRSIEERVREQERTA
jgi:hypothetical protein